MKDCKSIAIPLVVNEKLCKEDGSEAASESEYQQIVGSLLYLTATRPDVMFASSLLARFMHNPTRKHMGIAKRVLRYIQGTVDFGIEFVKGKTTTLIGYCDSDWAGSEDDMRSTSGYAFTLGSGMFSWASIKQNTVALSTAEVEYVSAAEATSQAKWLRFVLEDFGEEQVEANTDDAETWHSQGKSVILVRTETSPEDVRGMHAAAGILTARGGMTSHAAVVARGWGKCCVSGCSDIIRVNDTEKVAVIGNTVINEGEWLSLNGSTGEVILGKQPLFPPALSVDLETFMSWADKVRRLKVMANSDTPEDALTARNNGAQGIGLCRTEHIFFASDDRIKAVRRMIMAATTEQRKAALNLLLPYQRSDFEGIFRAMDGLPVTIRLLDPPLHEFLPEGDLEQIVGELTAETGMTEDEVFSRIEKLSEVNPMLGFRGCRLGISYPELTEMQARAIFQAAVSMRNQGVKVFPEIMVPLVGTPQELRHQVSLIRSVANKVFSEMGTTLSYKVGTMIEIPRAALVADEIAKEAEFFSFGTNDLTQMTFGYSRDDVGKFLPIYLSKGLLQNDPFEVLDQSGVGQLIKMATEKGRAARPSLKVGICGEHGGEPSSVAFFAEAGLDYVSCSPFRVPIARLAAAQVAV
ncbi:pyruvate, phosphate dikinase, chloroplastic-like [Prunus avium]|uniref:pyruvate, phosphate dikinase n=1 Tax=Prunus avium TaxID=42229 RepID=A0A6P5RQ69_PRUAV|nr:pyruvate, phosphate dikinase, chloroplastic-like [Prunus avium]